MKQNNSETVKHVLIRGIIPLVLLFVFSPLTGVLALLCLLIETVYLFKKDNKPLAIVNLKIFGFFIVIILLLFLINKGYRS